MTKLNKKHNFKITLVYIFLVSYISVRSICSKIWFHGKFVIKVLKPPG